MYTVSFSFWILLKTWLILCDICTKDIVTIVPLLPRCMEIHVQRIAKFESDQLLRQTRKSILSPGHYASVILGIVKGWFTGRYLFFICAVLCWSNQSLASETAIRQLRHHARSYSDPRINTRPARRRQGWNTGPGPGLRLWRDHSEKVFFTSALGVSLLQTSTVSGNSQAI